MKKSSVSASFSNLEHDVLVLKGTSTEAALVLLEGNINISTPEPLYIKRLHIRLYANIKLKQNDGLVNISFEKKLYEYKWNDNDINTYLNNLYENSNSNLKHRPTSLRNSSTSLHKLNKSSTSLSSSNLHMSSSSHTLIPGNYDIPFLAILPGDIPESVEGLPGANVTYNLEVIVEKGKMFQSSISTKKKLRVIRTLTTDSIDLSESVAVDNTWPNKVEYSLNVPTKAISIGSTVPISFMLVPLAKGLKLGKINIQLIEHYSYVGYVPPTYANERTIVEKTIKSTNQEEYSDKWEVNYNLQLPSSLLKVTQDCDISTNLKVRHKLKFVIGLINMGGHVSELRASLPIQLFISPFVEIHANVDEETLFTNYSKSTQDFQGMVAPPVYERHIYDRLWQDISPMNSPMHSPMSSGTITPIDIDHGTTDVNSFFSMLPLDSHQLSARLGQLNGQFTPGAGTPGGITNVLGSGTHSGSSSGAGTPRKRATFNLDDDQQDYFQGAGLASPGILSPPNHLSRVNSSESIMSQVPDYNQASSAFKDDISPPYAPPLPGSNINLDEVNKRFDDINLTTANRNKSLLSRSGGSSTNLSRSGSNTSSPLQSRTQSSLSLAVPSGAALSRSSSKRNIPNMSSSLPSASPTPTPHIDAHPPKTATMMPSSSASDRAANAPPLRSTSSLSLHNLSFLHKKKK